MKIGLVAGLFCLWLGLCPALAARPASIPPQDNILTTGDSTWDAFTSLQKRWMDDLYEIVVTSRPDLKRIATMSLEWRKAQMTLNTFKFKYILGHAPETLVRDRGIPAFLDLSWFPEYSEQLRKQDAGYDDLERLVVDLKKANNAHPKWPELKKYLKGLRNDPKFEKEFDRFFKEMAKVQKVLSMSVRDRL